MRGPAAYLTLGLVVSCAVLRPDDEPRTNTRPVQPNQGAGVSVLVRTPGHTFYVDRYEMAELGHDDCFAFPGHLPAVGRSSRDAEDICARFGRRLCTVDEWRYACLGVQGRRFSYANQFSLGRCNVGGATGPDAPPVGPLPTGDLAGCHSDEGVFDLVGNAMEWVRTTGPDGRAAALGGSYAEGPRADCFSTRFLPEGARSDQIGFRCCQDASSGGPP